MKYILAAVLLLRGLCAALAAEGPLKWEKDIAAFEAADQINPPPKNAILFTGSSSVRLWTNLAEAFPKKTTMRRGFGGSTMEDLLYYADRVILPYKPKQVLVYEGDNDLANGRDPKTVVAEFKQLCEKIHRELPRTKVWFLSVKPSPKRWHLEAKARELNDEIRAYTTSSRRLGYIDLWTPLLGPDGKPRPELFVSDQLHLNRDGYEIWAKVIRPKL